MQYASIIKSLGVILLILSLSMLIPTFFAIAETATQLKGFIFSLIATLLLGSIMTAIPKSKQKMGVRDGFVVVSFGWFLTALFGGLPYFLSGLAPAFTDAYFESMSGFTTTGASIFTDMEALPNSILLWRSMSQWLGGMGIIVLTIAILPYLDLGGMSLFQAEVPGPTAEKLTPRIQDTAKFLWLIYCFFTILLSITLRIFGMNWFDSVNHALATMATGGFSTKNSSIGGFQSSSIEWVIIIFMFFAGINFALHYRFIFKGLRIRNYFKDAEFKFYFFIILISIFIITFFLFWESPTDFAEHLRNGAFIVVSLITTTGFGTADYELWGYFSQFLLLYLMLVGGCAGSTSGGIKLVRIFLVFKYMYIELLKLIHPNLIKSITINNISVESKVIAGILGFIFIYIFVLITSILLVSIEADNMMTAIGSVVACLSNIGPGFGTVGPTENFAHLGRLTKWVLSLDMVMGRLEILTVMILFIPGTWKN